jgi:transposase
MADQQLHLDATGTADGAPCPHCGVVSRQVHGRYQRRPRDLPWRGCPARLVLTVRRFRCANGGCRRRTFAEPFEPVLARHAQYTHDARRLLHRMAYGAGGQEGARLAAASGLPASPDTLLRVLHRTAAIPEATMAPRVLGLDDWAWRRGHRYGTVLVDLQQRQIVDLLPDRSAEGVAQWLTAHPGLEVAARDRAGSYAEGVRLGAPGAVQIADRWHVMKNAGETLERVLQRHHADLRAVAMAPATVADATSQIYPLAAANTTPEPDDRGALQRPPAAQDLVSTAAAALPLEQQAASPPSPDRERRHALYTQVVGLREQGYPISQISQQLGIARATVRRFIRAGAFPERAPSRRWRMPTETEAAYLQQRWEEGCHTAAVLWRELRAQGYRGSSVTIRRFLAPWRTAPRRRTPGTPGEHLVGNRPDRPRRSRTPVVPSARQVRWWLLRHVDVLSPSRQRLRHPHGADSEPLPAEAHAFCQRLLARCPAIAEALTLTATFIRLVRSRDGPALAPWLVAAKGSTVVECREFARGVDRDRAAIAAALQHDWSTGPVEGQITKLKLVKRQAYGRASLPLLRARLLPVA